MAHEHSVLDTDLHFVIDPATRAIKNESGKAVIVQHDHNSERFTFEIPKEVDSHDMSLCNVVQIHYLNIEADTEIQYGDVYEVDDLKASGDAVTCSWLLSRNATQYVGTLNFVVTFKCVTDGEVTYQWSTVPHVGIIVSAGIHNEEVAISEYTDVLEQWRKALATAGMLEDYTPEELRAEIGAAGKSTQTTATLLAASWTGSAAPYTYALTVSGVTATSAVEIVETADCTSAQIEALQAANICNGAQTENKITLRAFGAKPTINLPILVIVRGDL